jgi:hypothetical protein
MIKEIKIKVENLNVNERLKGMYPYSDSERKNKLHYVQDIDKTIGRLNLSLMKKIGKVNKY